jgi:hypothetical protein
MTTVFTGSTHYIIEIIIVSYYNSYTYQDNTSSICGVVVTIQQQDITLK